MSSELKFNDKTIATGWLADIAVFAFIGLVFVCGFAFGYITAVAQ